MATATLNYAFGGYVLRTGARQLLRDGVPLRIGARPLAVLQVLVEHHPRTVSKAHIIEHVWEDGADVDNALHVHINHLRKRLGHGLIATVAGAGYRLDVPVRALGRAAWDDVLPGGERVRLIGRDGEVARLTQLLAAQPLVTVAGAPGSGKTTLARHVVARCQPHYVDGVAWIDLSGLAAAGDLVSATAAAARINAEDIAALRAQLAARDTLLVLDHAESRMEEVAALMAALHLASRGLRALVVSESPLQLPGEWVLRIGGLATPEEGAAPDQIRTAPAVALFAERAGQANEHFTLDESTLPVAAALCRSVDGLPLAIEQIAARCALDGLNAAACERALWIEEDDALASSAARPTTLASGLRAQYARLSAAHRALAGALAAFGGGFTRAAAHAVVDRPAAEVDAGIDALARCSVLLVEAADRFRLPAPTRRWLARAGIDAAHARRAADWSVARAAALRPLRETDPPAYRSAMAGEQANLVAALDWALGAASAAHALPLAADLARWWDARGGYGRARERLAAVLALPGADAAELAPARLRALNALAVTALYQGDATEAEPRFQAMLELATQLRDDGQRAWAHQGLGASALLRGDCAAAVRETEVALAHMRSAGDGAGLVACQTTLALASVQREDLGRAQAAAEAALVAARRLGSLLRSVYAHGLLGHVLWLAGDGDAGRSHLHTATELARGLDAQRPLGQALVGLGHLDVDAGDLGMAARHYVEGLAVLLAADLPEAQSIALIGVARLLSHLGRPADALRAVATVEAARARAGLHLSPYEQRALAAVTDELVAQAGHAAAESARTFALALPLRAGVDAALSALRAVAAPPPRKARARGSSSGDRVAPA